MHPPYIVEEIASHTCPICFDLMMPPDNSPTLLFPCGHTFCAACLRSHCDTHGKQKCPYCRQKIASQVGPSRIEVYAGSMGLGVQWDPVNWE